VTLLLFAGLPLFLGLCCLIHYVWHRGVETLTDVRKRSRFGQRLHDIVQIASQRSVLEHRAYAFKLHDNDSNYLDRALDVVQETMLQLQTPSLLGRRVTKDTLEVALPGRLEGEARSYGIPSPERDILRQLRSALLAASFERRSSSIMDVRRHKLHISSETRRLGVISKAFDSPGENITFEAFCEGISRSR